MNHPTVWQSPQPLWARFGASAASAAIAADQARPIILRFASDEFMEQLLGTLERDPARLDQLIARPETWRAVMGDQADLIERTPIPRLAQSATRRTLARRVKGSVETTAREADLVEQAQTRSVPLKLYQPAHQRFYLFAASLVCGIHGLPDRAVERGGPEQINFVMRRLMPLTPNGDPKDLHEYAYVKDASGASWRRVGSGTESDELAGGEELLPAFPLAYDDDAGRPRTLWTGFAPVGRREEYMGAPVDRSRAPGFTDGQRAAVTIVEPQESLSTQARVTQFQMEVAEPWKNLLRTADKMARVLADDSRSGNALDLNLQQQHISWLVLLDFADYLEAHLPNVWDAINHDGAGAASLPDARKRVYNWLDGAHMSSELIAELQKASDHQPAASLRAALKAVRAPGVRERLERTELSYTKDTLTEKDTLGQPVWPSFDFVLAGINFFNQLDGPYKTLDDLAPSKPDEAEPDPVRPLIHSPPEAVKVDRLTALIGRALERTTEKNAPPLPFALQLRNALSSSGNNGDWFVARFVHTNRDCGPIHLPRLSPPTQRFQLAHFFDSDAPARPIRITLPTDTSPAGLRKYQKNSAFIVSDMLCGQIQRAKGLGLIDLVLAILPWPLHKDLNLGDGSSCRNDNGNIGMICSLSIPIVTICALILLIIIVSLLDMVLRWLPFFIFCFPIPGLSGKKKAPA